MLHLPAKIVQRLDIEPRFRIRGCNTHCPCRSRQEEESDSIEQFILRAKKYPDLQELTPAVLHDLVNRVYVSAPDKSSGQRVQDVHIRLACIGFLPESIIAEMLTHASKSRTA